MKHYLVTGGCGFIGSHLTHELIKAGHKVTVLDDLSSGSIKNCAPGASFVKGCIFYNTPLLKSLMATVDGCFHLAAITSMRVYEERGWRAHDVNVRGTHNVLSQAKEWFIPVVYASSAAVYGYQQDFPIKEDAHICPASSYGRDKLYGEERVWDCFHRLYAKLPTMSIRFFNVYGPLQVYGCRYSGVISNFIRRATKGKNLIIYGDGYQTRDFLYIDDAIRVLMASMEKLHTMKGEHHSRKTGHYVINACTGEKTTIKELADLIIGLTNSKVECLYRKPNKWDIYESVGDPSRLKEILGITAQVSIIDGVRQTIGSIRS